MYPYIYQSDDFSIGTYGLMLATAYLTGRYLYVNSLNQTMLSKPLNASFNSELLVVTLLVFGVIGAKFLYVFKNLPLHLITMNDFLDPSGFSSQGALISAFLVTILFSYLYQVKLATLLDCAAPAAITAYLIARIGCFLAGDDCWGLNTDMPWGMSFPHGIAPTLADQTVHPVPLYEIFSSIIILFVLYFIKQSKPNDYIPFASLMILWGAARFLVEFVSTNPTKFYFMSGSQLGALIMFIFGSLILFYQLNHKTNTATAKLN